MLGQEAALGIAARMTQAGYHGYLIRETPGRADAQTQVLIPLETVVWVDQPNPHCLFTASPVTVMR